MQTLTNIQALIIDMDGVLWTGNQALPKLKEFFQLLREKKIAFILATNNSSLTPSQYVAKFKFMGVSISVDEILTSSIVTADYLATRTHSNTTTVFVIGEQGLSQALIDQGFILINSYQDKVADFVVCGLDRKLTWDKLADATLHLRAGAKLIATNADATLPIERGIVPGNGTTLAALETASDVKPIVIGKPEAMMYQHAMRILKVAPEKTVAIGDRLNTDILGAVNAGIRSIMVLTGISTKEDLKTINYQPTWILPDMQAIMNALQQ